MKGKLFKKALDFAQTMHYGQYDRAQMPYIMHCLKVLDILIYSYHRRNDENLLCIALLHDVMEDCNVSAEDLYNQGFSKRVVDAVTCLTRFDGETEDDYKNRVKSNLDAVLIKLCDLEHNMDLTRLNHVSEKDYNRNLKYQEFHSELKDFLNMILYNELTKNFKYKVFYQN